MVNIAVFASLINKSQFLNVHLHVHALVVLTVVLGDRLGEACICDRLWCCVCGKTFDSFTWYISSQGKKMLEHLSKFCILILIFFHVCTGTEALS